MSMKWVFWIFAILYALALLLFLVGNFGWFGQEKDPLSGIFLMPLGLPWSFIGDRLGITQMAVGLLSPAINLGIFYWLWKR
jgi:hypothetical protein